MFQILDVTQKSIRQITGEQI